MSGMTAKRADAPAIALHYRGALADLDPADSQFFDRRRLDADSSARATAADIIADVRARGDTALVEMARRFDGAELDSLEVPRAALTRALDETPADLRRAMERSAENIATVHRALMPVASEVSSEPGIVIGRRPDPLGRVGVYAPGGRASYPSSVLMGAIPARVAGVGEIILCSPPGARGLPAGTVLAAAALARVDRVFAVGGAGAIAAMALGTASIPRVDRIVGPGNAFVAAAKMLLVGDVAIDSPAGPSELIVIADDSSSPDAVAAEMVAQAEHDPDAGVIAIALDPEFASAIELALERVLRAAPRGQIAAAALANHGGVMVAESVAQAIEFANAYAPEHLLLALRDSAALLPRVRNAGTVFVGLSSSVSFGDYMTGANHVLPTGGTARVYSGLSPLDFVRWTTYQIVSVDAAQRLAGDVATFADAESLPAHAAAARRWRIA